MQARSRRRSGALGSVDDVTLSAVPAAGSSPAGRPRPSAGNPPLVTRGLIQTEQGELELVSRGVDFLTLTVSTDQAAKWLASGMLGAVVDEFAAGKVGFERGERRTVFGGHVSRRFDPRRPSTRWGLQYESWEWDGGHADFAMREVAVNETLEQVRPSRIDVAFDVACDEGYTASMLAEAIRPHVERNRVTPGVSGEGVHLTHYAGARASDSRVRIYRKDVQSPTLAVMGIPPHMRIEVMLHDSYAVRFWSQWLEDPEIAFEAAAGRVEALTGLVVQVGRREFPQLVKPAAADEAQALLRFVEQNGAMIRACSAVGLSVEAIAALGVGSRMTQHRESQRVDRLRRAGVRDVLTLVTALLRRQPAMS